MQERHQVAAPRVRRKKFTVEKDLRDFRRKHPTLAHLTRCIRNAYFGHRRFQKNLSLEEIWAHVQSCERCSQRYDALVRYEHTHKQGPRP